MNRAASLDAGTRRARGTVGESQTHNLTRERDPVSAWHARQLLTAEHVADRIGMTPAWVYGETRADRIPHVRFGRYVRYRVESIESWLEAIERGTVT